MTRPPMTRASSARQPSKPGYGSTGAGSGFSVAACDRRPLLDILCLLPRAERLCGVANRLLPSAARMLYAPTPRSEGGGSTSSPIRRENEISLLRRNCENRRSHAITGLPSQHGRGLVQASLQRRRAAVAGRGLGRVAPPPAQCAFATSPQPQP